MFIQHIHVGNGSGGFNGMILKNPLSDFDRFGDCIASHGSSPFCNDGVPRYAPGNLFQDLCDHNPGAHKGRLAMTNVRIDQYAASQ